MQVLTRPGRRSSWGRPSRRDDVVRVTSARRSHTDDLTQRQRRYLLLQLLRLVCFMAAVPPVLPVPVRVLLGLAGMLLPMMGVISANAGPSLERTSRADALLPTPAPAEVRALPQGRVIDQD